MNVHCFALAVCLGATFGSANLLVAQPPKNDLHGDPLPPGAIARLGTIRWRAGNSVILAAFLDQKTSLTVTQDHLAQVWDNASGKELRRFDSAGNARPNPADPRAMSMLFALGGNVAISANGQRLVVVGRDGVMRLWDTVAGKELRDFGDVGRTTMRLSLSPDGELLAAVGQDRSVKVWDIRNNAGPRSFAAADMGLNTMLSYRTEFSADGKTLLQVGLELNNGVKPVAILWDVARSAQQKRLELQAAGGNSMAVARAVIAPDQSMLGLPMPDTLTFVSVPEGKEMGQIKGITNGYQQTFLFSRDGKTLIGAGNDSLTVWEVPSGKVLRQFGKASGGAANPAVIQARANSVASISPDGKVLLTIDGPALTLTDLETGKRLNESAGHTGVLKEAFFARDGSEVWTRGADSHVRRWNATTGVEVGHIDFPDKVPSCLLSPDGNWLALGDGVSSVRLFEVATMKEKHSFAPDGGGIGYNKEFSPDSKNVAIVSRIGRSGFIYDVATGKQQLEFPLPPAPTVNQPMIGGMPRPVVISGINLPRRLLFSRDSRRIAIASEGYVTVWETLHGQQIGQIRLEELELLRHAALAPDGRTLAIETSSGTIIWELATNSKRLVLDTVRNQIDDPYARRVATLGAAAAFPMSMAYSPDGRLLARAGEDRKIRLWDVGTGKEAGSFDGHRGALVSASFAEDGKRLVTGSCDTTALVWDVGPIRDKLTRPSSSLSQEDIESHWSALINPDGAKAFGAIQALAGDPAKSVKLLRDRIEPAAEPDPKAVAKWIADLSNPKFSVRERARKELEHLGEAAAPALRQLIENGASAEARKVTKKLLEELAVLTPTGERLRALRVVEVLERADTPEAVELLKKLASGAAEVIPTPQAQAALERLGAKK
jgi:WD40 repeat protein